jgi:LDH2 family malate/lactate/ureidoglycolate dehydrogenase
MSAATAPGFKEVVVPGVYDFRMREKRMAEGIPVDENVWKMVIDSAKRVGVTIKE